MKSNVYDLEGNAIKEIDLPEIFSTPLRPDLIKRDVLSIQSSKRHPYGRDPMAGKKTSAESWGVGRGVSRVPRVKGSRHHAANRGAFVPQAVGGRLAFPPRPRSFKEKINRKERQLAIRSAIAATADKDVVEIRGHVINDIPSLPLIVENGLESLNKTKEVIEVLHNLGICWMNKKDQSEGGLRDVEKSKIRESKIRPGKGKRRGRRYKNGISVLIVYSTDGGIYKASRNISGVDVREVSQLNTELLAPGTHPGRLVLWTEAAINKLSQGLFNRGV
ncbi:MAG: 50S ribosomal protein L4 [Candidatus Hodarchaeales archaeon]|jgi:large subunit ribosomal protein L4e